jgi:glycosyltransferase involved in cell wall biosynthesis
MRVLMLGWEFPPFLAGGLGVACHGLTRSLCRMGHDVVFVLPKPVGENRDTHVTLVGPDDIASTPQNVPDASVPADAQPATQPAPAVVVTTKTIKAGSPQVPASGPRDHAGAPTPGANLHGTPSTTYRVPANFSNSYGSAEAVAGGEPGRVLDLLRAEVARAEHEHIVQDRFNAGLLGALPPLESASVGDLRAAAARLALAHTSGQDESPYGHDLIGDAQRYAATVLAIGLGERFDVIHGHDWLTYPAAELLAKATGKPLVVHIHATEFDRSGSNTVNQQVYDIERRGFEAADQIIAVSAMTKSIVTSRYGVDPSKVEVVYNGIEAENVLPENARIESKDKIVLFLGRLTLQKGPEYFIQAAKRVLEKHDDVKFVVAGSGDMAVRMIDMAADLGIGHKVFFTGFLRGADVDRVFQMADCFVMPSVSEPFGLVALEAIHNQTPVIISNQSGVAEVLTHALKVDFWDVDDMADKIVNVLVRPPLSQTLRDHGPFELRRLTWDGAAERCTQIYGSVIAGK